MKSSSFNSGNSRENGQLAGRRARLDNLEWIAELLSGSNVEPTTSNPSWSCKRQITKAVVTPGDQPGWEWSPDGYEWWAVQHAFLEDRKRRPRTIEQQTYALSKELHNLTTVAGQHKTRWWVHPAGHLTCVAEEIICLSKASSLWRLIISCRYSEIKER